ncbi:MAG: hypothetical protein AAGE52_25040 [Myxococcota bacterium]
MLRLTVVVGLLSFAAGASAQCYPECREGFVCSPEGQCVSICNPPCGAGEFCSADARCEPDASQTAPPQNYAPPPSNYAAPINGAVPEPAVENPALTAGGTFRLLANFDVGIGGTATIDIDGFGEVEGDLDPTLGMRLQALFPAGSLFFAGLNLGVDGYIGEGAPSDADRLVVIGVGPVFGFRYAINLGAVALEPVFAISLGFAVGTANDVELEDSAFGLEFGARGGMNVWFTEVVGANLNLGVQLHQLFTDESGVDVSLRLLQFRLGVGVILRFGAY